MTRGRSNWVGLLRLGAAKQPAIEGLRALIDHRPIVALFLSLVKV